MKPLSTGDTGVISPEASLATAESATQSALGAVPRELAGQAILDVPLVQLPEDVEEPVFALAQKITEETQQAGVPAGLPGMSGLGTGTDAQDILSGVSDDASSALTEVQGALSQATIDPFGTAQTLMNQAKSAVTGATGGAANTSTGATNSAAATTLTDDPVAALMNGLSLPALPGIETLFQPFLDLLSSFGTGVFGSLDPTSILSNSSAVIEQAMTLAQGGVKTVQQLWEGQSADAATAASQQAQVEGQETSQRGIDISALTQQAAAVVQTGNAQLTSIATAFAAQATALAPTIMLPPTQATLIGLATTHLGEAVTVVNATRGQLAGYTGELSGVVGQLASQSGLPSPEEVLQAASENIGEPLLTQAEDALSSATETSAASTGGTGATTTSPAGTSPAGTGGGGGSSAALGALGTARGGGGGGGGGGSSSGTPSTGSPKSTALPGSAMPAAGRVMATSLGTGMGGASTTPASAGSGFMGGSPGAAGAGQRGNDEEHGRTVQPYQSRTGNEDLTGLLGEATPEVIGAVHEDERTADEDRF
ncbi:hypothetical protein [Nocardia caishijiensis]|uniref:PPE family protein n=1 Tax=Nocardia caishijiensis TaxID=184756 RepID=A0ABQ6YPS6_9NOCA|nr:hypothetical protein [Nocardia caishijiensis]KAF0847481.1 hypothetical protein FNL39_103379 [Nocardia caishijiensis]